MVIRLLICTIFLWAIAADPTAVASGPKSTVSFEGYVSCDERSGACDLIDHKGALSQTRLRLVASDGKSPFDGKIYESNYVKVIGTRTKGNLKVFGISLSVPEPRIMHSGFAEPEGEP